MARALGSFAIAVSNSCASTSFGTTLCRQATISNVPNRDGTIGNVATLTCLLKVTDPVGSPVGTYVTMSGAGGTGYAELLSNYLTNVLQPAVARGWRVIQPVWESNGGHGYNAGTEGHLALLGRCATMLRGVYDNLRINGMPFVVMGQSGGAEQLCGALGHYGAGAYIDKAIPCSGPPMTDFGFGLWGPNHPKWAVIGAQFVRPQNNGIVSAYDGGDVIHMDQATGGTACQSKTVLGSPNYRQDSLLNTSIDLSWRQTDVHFIFGDADTGPRENGHYFSTFVKARTPVVRTITTGNVHHVDVPGSPSGAAAILAALDSATLNH